MQFDNTKISNKIKELKLSGATYKDIADRIGVSHVTISGIKDGTFKAEAFLRMLKIIKYFNLKVEDVIYD